MPGYSLRTLRQNLGYELDDIVVSTVTANGSSSLVIDTTNLPAYETGYFDGQWIRSNGAGSSANQVRVIDRFTATSGQLELRTPFSAALSTVGPDQFEIHRKFDPAWKDWAIKRALRAVWPDVHNPTVDRSLTGVDGQYVYTLPSTIQDKPAEIFEEQDNGENLPPLQRLDGWTWFRSGATAKVEFRSPPGTGRVIRIRHMAVLTEPASDTATTEVYAHEEPIVLAQAALLLYSRLLASASGQGREEAQEDMQYWRSELEARIAKFGMPPLLPSMHVYTETR